MSVSGEAPSQDRSRHPLTGLLVAAHVGPALAVTVMATAYAAALDLGLVRVALVCGAVLAGQLTIGWSNDLVDRAATGAVGRTDKPLATGDVSVATVRIGVRGRARRATVALSLACGLVAGPRAPGRSSPPGWAYNLGLKATVLSWLPYAVAFGGLPVFVALAEPGAGMPAGLVPAAGALLGVGAHLVNALPDLADDEATGVRRAAAPSREPLDAAGGGRRPRARPPW